MLQNVKKSTFDLKHLFPQSLDTILILKKKKKKNLKIIYTPYHFSPSFILFLFDMLGDLTYTCVKKQMDNNGLHG